MIREIENKDYEKIYELGKELHENFKSLYPLDKITQTDYIHLLVYEKNEEIVGFLTYTELHNTVDILDLVVDALHRRKKIATALIDYMITNINPTSTIYLEVSVENQAAIDLYEKFGFVKIHTRKKYYGTEDAYVMERVSENE
ncbi:TPA: GNAT family N-acetyltransferase [Candidatus Ventrenecus avicola]|nr:GNAT family N-acetyltransferase [Candidatus Ventrenecus avicola]